METGEESDTESVFESDDDNGSTSEESVLATENSDEELRKCSLIWFTTEFN